MAEVIIRAGLASGRVDHRKTNGWPSWSEVRNGAGTHTQTVYSQCIQLYPGGYENGNQVWVRVVRTIPLFDTTIIPPSATILNVSLWVRAGSRGDFDPPWKPNFCVVSAAPASYEEIVAGDYNSLGVTPLSNNIVSWDDWLNGVYVWHEFVLTQAGIDEINKGDITAFGFRNYNYDALDNEPTIGEGSGWAHLGIGYTGDDRPYLVITYLSAAEVTTNPATGISTRGATLNGRLIDDGSEDCDCGFEWGETSAYGHITATVSRNTGQYFSKAIAGLEPNTIYHFRAFAINSVGTGYGIDRTFTTLGDEPLPPPPIPPPPVPPEAYGVRDIVTLEAIRNIEMTCLGRFYIDEQGNAKYESRFHRSI